MLLALGRASGAAPFGPAGAAPDEPAARRRKRSPLALVLGLGLGLAVVATLVPFVIVLVVGVAAALTLGSILCFRIVGLARMLVVAAGASLLAVVLNLPWMLDLVTGPAPWQSIAGISSSSAAAARRWARSSASRPGPWGAPPLGWAFLLAGALPVIIGRSWRLEWAVRAWIVVLAGWGVALGRASRPSCRSGCPAPRSSWRRSRPRSAWPPPWAWPPSRPTCAAYRFGWRQVLAVVAGLGVVLGAAPLASGLFDGRWRTPTNDFLGGMDALLDDTERRARSGSCGSATPRSSPCAAGSTTTSSRSARPTPGRPPSSTASSCPRPAPRR